MSHFLGCERFRVQVQYLISFCSYLRHPHQASKTISAISFYSRPTSPVNKVSSPIFHPQSLPVQRSLLQALRRRSRCHDGSRCHAGRGRRGCQGGGQCREGREAIVLGGVNALRGVKERFLILGVLYPAQQLKMRPPDTLCCVFSVVALLRSQGRIGADSPQKSPAKGATVNTAN